MKKTWIAFILFVLFTSMVSGGGSHIPVTRLVSQDGTLPINYNEWRKTIPNSNPASIGNVGIVEKDGGMVNVVVNAILYPKLTYFLDPSTGQFVLDLVNDGWSVSVDTMAMTADPFAPETLRNFLINEYNLGSVGAVLIGDLPVAWFQMMEVFWGSNPSYTDFPIDLFYMDMDGVWQDNYKEQGGNLVAGSDSIYDTHTGNMAPEIFVGRLTASPAGNDSALIHDNLERNHHFRIGSMQLSKEALFYNDDDWTFYTPEWSGQLRTVYDSILIVDHPETTTANDYRNRLPVSHEWISVFVHSSPTAHAFKYNGGSSWSWFYSNEIPVINPVANFYNLFACSNARYTQMGNCASMYAFRNDYGLGALGSSKTGSMLEFQYFYNPLSQGKCIGDAFKDWFAVMGEAWGDTSRSWFYGMTFIGDPCLVVKDSVMSIAETAPDAKPVINVSVLPNPATDYVEFQVSGKKTIDGSISIYGIDGRIIWQSKINGASPTRWNCSDVPTGVYFSTISAEGKKYSDKIVLLK